MRSKKKKASKSPPEKDTAKVPKKPKVEAIDKAVAKHEQPYALPRGCSMKTVENDIRRYQCFEFEDRVYVMRDKVAVAGSNFTCAIHMHIKGDVPTRLITIRNDDKEVENMHVAHDVFNSLQMFRKTVTGTGNYQWTGTEGDYMRYLWFMMDRMGKGRMVLEPGMQHEGFYAFVNKVIHGDKVIALDPFGCFDIGSTKYYIPAANSTTGHEDEGYGNARKVIYIESDVTFEALSRQQLLVHGNHAMLALVHAVGTVFSDHIRHRVDGFPIPFYYGPPGTGKDQVVKGCQRLQGKPQAAIRLPAANTAPAMVNVFAELRNNSLYGTEWSSGLKDHIHTFCMGCWDGEGRRRGEKIMAARSRFSTEDVPIRCTLSMSGNEYPNFLDQLLDRLVVTEMEKLALTMEQRNNFRVLNDMNEKGFSYLLADVVKHREEFLRDWFNLHYQRASEMVQLAMGDQFVSERMRKNMCILVSIHLFFAPKLKWAFTTDQLTTYLVQCMVRQQDRRLSGDEVSNFWSCFISGVNTRMLVLDKHFALPKGAGTIGFFWSDVFPVYMERHRQVFGGPGKRDILNKLKQHPCFVPGAHGKDYHAGYRIGRGNTERKSSAFVFDTAHTGTDLVGLLSTETADVDDLPL